MKSNIYTFGIPFGFSALAFFYYFFWKNEEKKPDELKPTEKQDNSSKNPKDLISGESSHENSSQKQSDEAAPPSTPSKSTVEITEPEIVQEQKKDVLNSSTTEQTNGEDSLAANLEKPAVEKSDSNRLESVGSKLRDVDVESIGDDAESTEDGAESTEVEAESSDAEIESSDEEVTARTEIEAKDVGVNGKDNVEASDADVEASDADVEASDADVEASDADVEASDADVKSAAADVETTNAQVEATGAEVDTTNAEVEAANNDVEAPNADEQTADADEQTADADEQTADADEQTADADEQTADADEQTADADKEAADADVDNAYVETADANVETADSNEKDDLENKDETGTNSAVVEDIESQIIVGEVEKMNTVDTEVKTTDMQIEVPNTKIESVTAAINSCEKKMEDEEKKEDLKSEIRLADDSIEVLDISSSLDDTNNESCIDSEEIKLVEEASTLNGSKPDSSAVCNGVDISAIMEKLTMNSTESLTAESDSHNVTEKALENTHSSDNGNESSGVKNVVNKDDCQSSGQDNKKTNCGAPMNDSSDIKKTVSNGDKANANTTIDLSESIIEVPNDNQSSSVAPPPFKLKPDFYGQNIFYSNHTLKETGFPFIDDGTPYDCQKVWEQPDDGMVFVKGSAGQPLVPTYLRNTKFLAERTIPIHEPNQYGFIARNMKAPSFRALQWVRVISISQSLEIRVRHDQRDMLLDKLQKDGIIDQEAPPIRAANLEVGCLVGTLMNVPLQGPIWCRVIITQIVQGQDDVNRRGNRRYNSEPLFMFESIDYFPLKSERPVNTQQMRALKKEALEAPFFDEIIYLTNSMPRNRQWYEKSARDALVKLVNQSDNYLYIKSNVGTHINGYYHSFAPLYARWARGTDKTEVLVQRHLLNLQYVVPIYEGLINDQIVYSLCMFKDNDSFWMDDDRYYEQVSSVWPKADYIYVTHAHSARTSDLKGYQGFNIPFRHDISGFMQNDFNMTAQQYSQMHLHSRPQDQFSNQHLRDSLLRKDVPLDCNFSPQTYIQLFMTDLTRRTQSDQLVNNEFFVAKDRNGFLLLRYL